MERCYKVVTLGVFPGKGPHPRDFVVQTYSDWRETCYRFGVIHYVRSVVVA